MYSPESKKLALTRIKEIFETYSDFEHPLTQNDIAEHLDHDYGINIDRKTIGRNISLLKETGIEIESDHRGSYLGSRLFEDSELRMLIDGILCSKYITAKHSEDLIKRICGLSNIYFRSHIKNIFSVTDRCKTENPSLFYNIEVIDDAIEKNRQITFDYNKYGADKQLHKSAEHTASPYQLIVHNQRYYLMALNEQWQNIIYYRLDRITNMRITDLHMTPLRSIKGYENGIDYGEISSALPYMFADKPQTVEMIVSVCIIDQVIDWFGKDIRICDIGDGKFKITLRVSLNAMEYWAMQYINFAEIVSPAGLHEKIKDNLSSAAKNMNNKQAEQALKLLSLFYLSLYAFKFIFKLFKLISIFYEPIARVINLEHRDRLAGINI